MMKRLSRGRVGDISRALSRQSFLSFGSDKVRIKEILQDHEESSGTKGKVKQTLQMITMVILPIIALLSVTTVTLVSTIDTFSKSTRAQNQLKLLLQVRETHIFCNSKISSFWLGV